MKAVWYRQNGPADEVLQFGELDAPEPAAGQVRVRISRSGVNPVDVKRRQGRRGAMKSAMIVPHFDGAGAIDMIGEGVDAARLGQRVWVYEAQWGRDFGTAAEYVVVENDRAVSLPDNATFDAGACLGISAMTAHRCVFGDGRVEGKTVLVTGGAGGVGFYAIQMARLDRATVIATVSSDEKAGIARKAGAHHVINYKTEDVAERVNDVTEGRGVDRVVEVEFGGNLESSIDALKPSGVLAAYASQAEPEPVFPYYRLAYKSLTVRCVIVFLMPDAARRQAIEDITRWLEEGRLNHHIGSHFKLEDTAAAHHAVENGAVGKVIVDVAELEE